MAQKTYLLVFVMICKLLIDACKAAASNKQSPIEKYLSILFLLANWIIMFCAFCKWTLTLLIMSYLLVSAASSTNSTVESLEK